MAKFSPLIIFYVFVAFAATHSAEGRKLLQAVGQKSYSGDITAAASQTAANIQSRVANGGRPGTATTSVRAGPTSLKSTTVSTVSDSRYTNKKSFTDTAAAGSDTVSQASRSAAIASYASGGARPTPRPTSVRLANVPSMAAQLPTGSTARGAGVSASLNAATSSAINSKIEAQAAIAAHNAQPGPNIAGYRP